MESSKSSEPAGAGAAVGVPEWPQRVTPLVSVHSGPPPAAPAPAPAAPAPAPAARAPSVARAALLAARVLALAAALAVAIAALSIALPLARPPEVLASSSAAAPAGFTYAGPAWQGSGYVATGKPALPAPVSDAGVALVSLPAGPADGVGFVLGGLGAAGATLSSVYTFDPTTETFTASRAPMPRPLYRFATASIGTTLYVVAGITSAAADEATAFLSVYDAVADAWSAGPNCSVARTDAAAAAAGGLVFLFGGYSTPDYTPLSSVEAFNPVVGAWAPRAPLPTPRGDLLATLLAGAIYVTGGWTAASGGAFSLSAAVEAFDAATGAWRVCANMLTGRGDHAAAVYRGKLFVFGGEGLAGPTHDISSFSPGLAPATAAAATGAGTAGSDAGVSGGRGVWAAHAPMPGPRYRGVAVPGAQGVFLLGGQRASGVVVDTATAFYDTDHPAVFLHTRNG